MENALYDPAFVHYDPNSTTETFQPNERDITYSKYHPDLVAVEAAAGRILQDGLMPSGEAIDNNDPLTRRDEGLAFLDVTPQASIKLASSDINDGLQSDVYWIKNSSNSIIDTNLLVIANGLPSGVQLIGPHTGVTSTNAPYLRVYLTNGVLNPGDSTMQTLRFKLPQGSARLSYNLDLLSGQGNPSLPIPRVVRVSGDKPPAF